MRMARCGNARFDRRAVVLALLALLAAPSGLLAQGIDRTKLVGVVIDNAQATLTGEWKRSTSVRPFVDAGYIHDDNTAKGERQVRFSAKLPKAGEYEVRISYSTGGSRATPRRPRCPFFRWMPEASVRSPRSETILQMNR